MQKAMNHFDVVVFKGTAAAEVCGEDADSSEINLGLDDLSIGDDNNLPSSLNRTQDPSTRTGTDPEHSSPGQFNGATGSSQAATPSHTTQFQLLSPGDPMAISQASTFHHPHPSSDQHAHSVHPANLKAIPCSHISANSIRLPDSRQHVTPTPSVSAPPPPIIDTELQHDSDDDIMPDAICGQPRPSGGGGRGGNSPTCYEGEA